MLEVDDAPALTPASYGEPVACWVAATDAGGTLGLLAPTTPQAAELLAGLTVRGGTGTEAFYLAEGYRVVGRLPGALRLTDGDDRDELHLWKDLGS